MNSQRKMHGSVDNVHSQNSNFTQRSHPKYHRNADVAIMKAQAIDQAITKGNKNDTPSPNRYKKATIFDPEKAEIKAASYRDSHNDNLNKIINNNTQFRIFNQMKPRDSHVAPLENLNLNPNKWKPKVTYYYQENKGDVTELPDSTAHNGYSNHVPPSNDRHNRLLNSKRKLQNYLELVSNDPRYMNARYREHIASKSAMTKLPEHDTSVYAVPEMARHGPTNKTIARFHRNGNKVSSSSAFGLKDPAPGYPVLDVQRRQIIDRESNIDALRSRRYQTIDHGEVKAFSNSPARPQSIHGNPLLTPKNPRPLDFKRNVSTLDVGDRFDKVGGVTYRDNNAKAVFPLNEK
jgi:hypothetical protein